MKVLFVVEAALGGTGEVVLQLLDNLRSEHEIGLVYSAHRIDARFDSGKSTLERAGAAVHEAALHPYRGPRALAASWSTVRREAAGYDVVHVHGAWGGMTGRAALWRSKKPIVYNPHGGAFHPRGRGLYAAGRRVERVLARKTGAVVVSSSYEESLVRAALRNRTRVELIAHGRPSSRPIGAIRSLPTAPRFGVVGRVVEEKRLDLAVDALKLAKERLPGAQLVVVGSGPHEQEVTRRAHAAGLASAVTMRGFVEDKAEIYGAFDVLLLPSDSEAAPLVVAEAQEHGVPAIVAASGGGQLAVQDGIDGLVVARDDPAGMARAMTRMTGSADAYEPFARAALEAAARYPSWQEVTERYVDLYRHIGAPA